LDFGTGSGPVDPSGGGTPNAPSPAPQPPPPEPPLPSQPPPPPREVPWNEQQVLELGPNIGDTPVYPHPDADDL
jgi:hypothetical protein